MFVAKVRHEDLWSVGLKPKERLKCIDSPFNYEERTYGPSTKFYFGLVRIRRPSTPSVSVDL